MRKQDDGNRENLFSNFINRTKDASIARFTLISSITYERGFVHSQILDIACFVLLLNIAPVLKFMSGGLL